VPETHPCLLAWGFASGGDQLAPPGSACTLGSSPPSDTEQLFDRSRAGPRRLWSTPKA